MGSDLAAVVVLRDVIPLLLPMGKEAALISLSIAKANSQVYTLLNSALLIRSGIQYTTLWYGL